MSRSLDLQPPLHLPALWPSGSLLALKAVVFERGKIIPTRMPQWGTRRPECSRTDTALSARLSMKPEHRASRGLLLSLILHAYKRGASFQTWIGNDVRAAASQKELEIQACRTQMPVAAAGALASPGGDTGKGWKAAPS